MLAATVAASALIEAGRDEITGLAFPVDSSDTVPGRLASDPSGRVFTPVR
jgi:hypothetical protein